MEKRRSRSVSSLAFNTASSTLASLPGESPRIFLWTFSRAMFSRIFDKIPLKSRASPSAATLRLSYLRTFTKLSSYFLFSLKSLRTMTTPLSSPFPVRIGKQETSTGTGSPWKRSSKYSPLSPLP